ncbi:TolC family protein [Luteibacter yeojuensis]|uniref:TolC family protein n=1 Tax=Luteibacter yeojuensis TaxID=345309 RepID=A0A7X5QXB9_9GAMM|nr:TolC family protein [Luteibacter yeojuensis]
MNALVDEALASNLGLEEAIERLRAARALHGTADARFRPQLDARTDNFTNPDTRSSSFVAGFDATWELDLFGRGEATRHVARGALDGAASDLRAAQVSLVAEVARTWLSLRAAQEQAEWLTRIRDIRARQYGMLTTRRRLRLANEGDVQRAGAALALAEAALVEPRDEIDTSAQQLAVLLGQPEPDPAWFQAAPMPTLGNWHLDAAPADLLRSRPEILHAQADVLHAAGEAGLARANRYPSLAIGGSLYWSGGSAIPALGPLVDIPLFDWGMRAAAADAKAHELKASVLAYRAAVLHGVAEVETALGRLSRETDYEQRMAESAAATDAAHAIVVRRVALKLAGPMEQAESSLAHDQAALALVQARASRGLGFVALFKAFGGAPLPTETD